MPSLFRAVALLTAGWVSGSFPSVATAAETLVLPNSLANRDSIFGAGTLSAANYRSQQVYGATHFPEGGALVITELRFRPDYFHGRAFSTTIANIQVNLSTTTRNPDALNTAFANNPGPDDRVVFSGALAMSSQFIGPPTGPKNFDMIIPLSTPFIYNPAAGNLLLDVRNFSGSTASLVSGEGSFGDSASRVGGSLGSATGVTSTGIEALQIVYTVTNAPPVPPQPTLLTRGPYLQTGTPTNIVVRWRTNRKTNSVVRFGLSEAALLWAITNAPMTNEHIVTLTNLLPGTKYFYAISATETNLAGGGSYYFTTAPLTAKPTRIWALGDSGTANQPKTFAVFQDPFAVRDAYYNFAGQRETDVWLMLGDNAYLSGTDDQYQTNVFDTFPSLLRRSVVWPTIGNHEVDATGDATAYLNIFSLPVNGEAGGLASGNEHYYSFNYGNIHFVCLDSEISSRAPGGAMLTWLEQDLAANMNDWVIAFWHTPPYTYGSHNSDDVTDSGGKLIEMRENVVPILDAYGVDLVLCGHSHNYERSYLIDGHYGYASSFVPTMAKDSGSGRVDDSGAYLKSDLSAPEHQGAVYVVCGSSGWATPGHPSIPTGKYLRHPAMFIGLQRLGSLVIDIDGQRLDAKFLRETGAIDDYFSILKGAEAAPLRFATFKVQNGTVTAQFKTIAGQRYRVDQATRLDSPDWQPASGEMTATGVTTKWTAAAPLEASANFYRVVLVSAGQ